MDSIKKTLEHRREVFRDNIYNGLWDFISEHKYENIENYLLILNVDNLTFKFVLPEFIHLSASYIPVSEIITEADSDEFGPIGSLIPDVEALDEAIDLAFFSAEIEDSLN